jgi:DNA-binding NtrC family response regulator
VEQKPKKRPLILLVDDEKIVLEVVLMMLENIGFEVLTAKDGHEAIKLYKINQKRIDLVILDMIMPHGGEKTFYDLKAIDAGVKVLLTSGYAEDQRVRHLIRQGARGFIQKPFSIKALRNKITRALN